MVSDLIEAVGCHTALKSIRAKFQPSVWVIEGDILQCFPSIDHKKLMNIIESKILDRQFTKLIWKALKAGYFEFNVYSNDLAGTPQGSIISPILSNIYMSQLDDYVNSMKGKFDIGSKSKISKMAARIHSQSHLNRSKARGDMKKVLVLSKLSKTVPWADFVDPSFKKLSYVRYADDWVIGIKGSYSDTKNIYNLVKLFLSSIGLTLSDCKTKLTNLNKSRVLFLGTYITRAKEHSFTRVRGNFKRN